LFKLKLRFKENYHEKGIKSIKIDAFKN
jgi:hypothetical protein